MASVWATRSPTYRYLPLAILSAAHLFQAVLVSGDPTLDNLDSQDTLEHNSIGSQEDSQFSQDAQYYRV